MVTASLYVIVSPICTLLPVESAAPLALVESIVLTSVRFGVTKAALLVETPSTR